MLEPEAVEKEWIDILDAYLEHTRDERGQAHYVKQRCLLPLLLENLVSQPETRLLDIGCGDAWLEAYLGGVYYHGLDIALPSYLSSKDNLRKESLRTTTFPKGYFDVCIASMVFPFIADLDSSFASCLNLLVGGGKLYVLIPEPFFYNTGTVDNNGYFLVSESLRENHKKLISIGKTLPPVTYFFRRTSQYLNAAIQTGFHILGLHESFLDLSDYYEKFDRRTLSKQRSDLIPMFQLMVLQKPLLRGDGARDDLRCLE